MEQRPSERHEKLTTITDWATEEFGEGAYFTYVSKGQAFTLTLSEALEVCGAHIAEAPLPIVQVMLRDMRQKQQVLKNFSERHEASVTRGQELMARVALARER